MTKTATTRKRTRSPRRTGWAPNYDGLGLWPVLNAIAIQEQAIEEILSASVQGKRASCYGMSLLNRNPRVIQGIHTRMRKALTRCGYQEVAIERAWSDVKDMARLREGAGQC